MITKMTQRFFIREDRKSQHGYPIMQRITINRKKSERVTGYHLSSLGQWDEYTRMPKTEDEIHIALQKLKVRTIEIHERLNDKKARFSARDITAALDGKDGSYDTFIQMWEAYIDVRKQNVSTSSDLGSRLTTTLEYYRTFAVNNRLEQLRPKGITRETVDRFEAYLSQLSNKNTGKPFARNNVVKHLKRMKQACAYGVDCKFMDENPFGSKKLRGEKKRRIYLTEEQLKAIMDVDLSHNESLDRVRDIFLFSCFTGLRFAHAIKLRVDEVEIAPDGSATLIRIQKDDLGAKPKANQVPILPQAIDIINKYREEAKVTGYILPRYSNQKVNTYLKVIADLAGVKVNITHHVARHTFGTTILAKNGADGKEIQVFMGHKDIRNTMQYTRVHNSSLDNVLSKVDNRLQKVLGTDRA